MSTLPNTISILLIVLSLMIFTYAWARSIRYQKNKETLICVSKMLWMDHVYFTREYLLLAFVNPSAAGATAKRLLQNQTDIGNFFGAYYGADVGSKVTSLLTDHINIAVTIVGIVNQPTVDQDKLQTAQASWTANANDISTALRGVLNIDLSSCMTDHLATTTTELLDIKAGNWDKAIQDFEEVVSTIMDMAIKIADAIAKNKKCILETKKMLPCCSG